MRPRHMDMPPNPMHKRHDQMPGKHRRGLHQQRMGHRRNMPFQPDLRPRPPRMRSTKCHLMHPTVHPGRLDTMRRLRPCLKNFMRRRGQNMRTRKRRTPRMHPPPMHPRRLHKRLPTDMHKRLPRRPIPMPPRHKRRLHGMQPNPLRMRHRILPKRIYLVRKRMHPAEILHTRILLRPA